MSNLSAAQQLNQSCEWVTSNLNVLQSLSTQSRIENNWTKMLSKHPVFVEQQHVDTMNDVISTITSLSQDSTYQALVEPYLPNIASISSTSLGALFGYDFHITEQGPKLIEVNTNAGASYFNDYLNQSQQACCNASQPLMRHPVESQLLKRIDGSEKINTAFEELMLAMFYQEFSLQFPERKLQAIAIVDEDPTKQFLYPELCLFKQLFESAGIRTFIVDPAELSHKENGIFVDETRIDLIYNRHTDFYLNDISLEPIRSAYLKKQLVLTPNPRNYGLAADKRLMHYWSDPDFLNKTHLSRREKELLLKTVPKTRIVELANADAIWAQRKHLFLKPLTGFGSRASYSGAKLTKKTWQNIVKSNNYIAQEFVPPSSRLFNHEGELRSYKVDFRNYVYNGHNMMLSARLYRGQTTNMKTSGGGFATVYSTEKG